VRDSNPRLPA